jgi:hypothetical protein
MTCSHLFNVSCYTLWSARLEDVEAHKDLSQAKIKLSTPVTGQYDAQRRYLEASSTKTTTEPEWVGPSPNLFHASHTTVALPDLRKAQPCRSTSLPMADDHCETSHSFDSTRRRCRC